MSASSRRLIAALALSLCAAVATTQVGVASAAGAPRPALSAPAQAAPSDLVALDAGPIPIDRPPIRELRSSNDPGADDSANGSALTDSGGGGGSGGGTSGSGSGGNYAWVLYVGGGVLAFIVLAGWVGGRNE